MVLNMSNIRDDFRYIRCLLPEDEARIKKIPFLNIDTVLVPSPFILEKSLDIDYRHSYVWDEEGEILGYFLIYSNPSRQRYHLYQQVTSPFGRGKGIGSAFIETLASDLPDDAYVYLFVWEKLISTIEFFSNKGFKVDEKIVNKKMKFLKMSALAKTIREKCLKVKETSHSIADELGKVRHDVKKSLKVLFDMTSILSVDNYNKVVEDINRETTALLNTLNLYEDRLLDTHNVNIKELITDRLIPFIESAKVPCEIRINLGPKISPVVGNYLKFSRALINLASNSIDAIDEAERKGIIIIDLRDNNDYVRLTIQDNGIGINEERLRVDKDFLPDFVGKTTKKDNAGEGLGTIQIFSTFGANNIKVESRKNHFTRWIINLKKSTTSNTIYLSNKESAFIELLKKTEKIGISVNSPRTQVAIFIWQLRQMEIFSYDLIYQFAQYNNVRDIFRNTLSYRFGTKKHLELETDLNKCRIENQIIKTWLLAITKRIKRNERFLKKNFDFDEYKGMLFKSYGQALNYNIIFTLDPENGHFFATDRKLAEHMDFVPYLGKSSDQLLRGEFIGDVKNLASPICLGVWTADNPDDLRDKLLLLQKGAKKLLEMGLKEDKGLSFYNITHNRCSQDLDTTKSTTLGRMASMSISELERLLVTLDDSEAGFTIFAD